MSKGPQVVVHMGQYGYCASIDINTEDALDPIAWALKMENLRHNLLLCEKRFKERGFSLFEGSR